MTATTAPPARPGSRALPGGADDASGAAPRRPNLAFLLRHPAHAIALGFGTGLSPWAPGTVGTLWGWLAFLLLWPWLSGAAAVACALAAFGVGWWACTRAAQHLGIADPGAIVWDEILAFALVLAVVMPADWPRQLLAFALFRFFDAVKPGPVGAADRRFKPRPGEAIGWRQGFGILVDDLVAAGCTLLVLALVVRLWG